MKRLLVAVVVTASVLSFAGSLSADDFAPLPWRGTEGSAWQIWEFRTPAAQAVAPDPFFNLYGARSADIVAAPAKDWLASYLERDGVWPLSGSIEIMLPNQPIEKTHKDIYIQLAWARTPCPTAPFTWEKRFGKVAALVF